MASCLRTWLLGCLVLVLGVGVYFVKFGPPNVAVVDQLWSSAHGGEFGTDWQAKYKQLLAAHNSLIAKQNSECKAQKSADAVLNERLSASTIPHNSSLFLLIEHLDPLYVNYIPHLEQLGVTTIESIGFLNDRDFLEAGMPVTFARALQQVLKTGYRVPTVPAPVPTAQLDALGANAAATRPASVALPAVVIQPSQSPIQSLLLVKAAKPRTMSLAMKTRLRLLSLDLGTVGGVQCATGTEGQTVYLRCGQGGGVIDQVEFASYGTPVLNSHCSEWHQYACHAPNSMLVVENRCLGKESCTIPVSILTFAVDPCDGYNKYLAVRIRCSVAQQPARSDLPGALAGASKLEASMAALPPLPVSNAPSDQVCTEI
jgi:hypothetical protein